MSSSKLCCINKNLHLDFNHMQDLIPGGSSAKKPTFKRPFLKRGEGIARFGLKSARVKFKNKSLQEQNTDREQVMHLNRGKCLRSMSTPLLNSKQSSAGILAGQDGCEVRKMVYGVMLLDYLLHSLVLALP